MHRANNFDALRLLGALLVFYSHQFALTGRPEPMLDAASHTSLGSVGVYLFFSVSGFLVLQSWTRDPSAWRFAKRRFLRVWPGMAAVIVLTSLGLFALTPVSLESVVAYLANVYCLGCSQGRFFPGNPYPTLYGSMWSIPVEVQCYALLLAAGLLFGRRLAIFITGLAACAQLAPVAQALLPDLLEWVGFPRWIACGAFFLAGCMLATHEPLRRRAWLPALGGSLLLARGETVLGLIFVLPAAVVWIGTRSWPVLRSAGRFGDLSYGIYLWAWPVQQVLVMTFGRSTPFWTLMGLALVVTVILAALSWHLIEAPALKLKPSARGNEIDRSAPARAAQ